MVRIHKDLLKDIKKMQKHLQKKADLKYGLYSSPVSISYACKGVSKIFKGGFK